MSQGDEPITWIPAEFAVAKFSLRDGLINAKHWFPLPGVLPPGSKWECLNNSEKLNIPLEQQDAGFNKPDLEIVNALQNFLGDNKEIFVMPEMEDQVRGVLDTIYKRSEQPSLNLTFLELPRLFYQLKIVNCVTEEERERQEKGKRRNL